MESGPFLASVPPIYKEHANFPFSACRCNQTTKDSIFAYSITFFCVQCQYPVSSPFRLYAQRVSFQLLYLELISLSVSATLFSCTCIHTNTPLPRAITISTICLHYSRFRVYFCLVSETCITSSKNYLALLSQMKGGGYFHQLQCLFFQS